MKNIKYILISSISIFMLNVLVHYVYNILPFDIVAIIFPTNESIFQHVKMIFTSFLIFYLILFFMKRRFKYNNIFLTNIISVPISIIFFLSIYLIIRFRFGEIMIVTFILLFISIMLGQALSYNFLKKDNDASLNMLSLIIIVIIFIIMGYFTFNPIHNDMFWDSEHETYEKVTK